MNKLELARGTWHSKQQSDMYIYITYTHIHMYIRTDVIMFLACENVSICLGSWLVLGGVCFGVFCFFCARFFFVGGWCRLELCHFCKLWQEKCRIADELRVLQPNAPFRA